VLRPLGSPLRYWPGQYVMLGDAAAGITPRSYSIANAPRPDGEIVLQVSHFDGGHTSSWIYERLQVGDLVNLAGPYGTFIGDPSVDTPVLCMAAGSGLAPILSLADAALRRGFRPPVTLLFSARTSADVYDRGLLMYWQARYPNFRFLVTLTRERREGELHGRIPGLLPGLFPDLSGYSVFVAGSPSFVDDCVAAARRLGARDGFIHTEGYFSEQHPEASVATTTTG